MPAGIRFTFWPNSRSDFASIVPASADRFLQTLYIFFGVAVLIGILSGTVLHYVSAFGFTVLNLERHSEKQSGKSIDSYRAEKQMRAEQKDPFLKLKRRDVSVVDGGGGLSGGYADWQRPKQDRGRTGPRLVPNTILEEDSTDDGF